MRKSKCLSTRALLIFWTVLLVPLAIPAQDRHESGKSIGKVSVLGKLILVELNPGALGHENLFNLDHSTLRFTPEKGGYRVERLPLQWSADFGQKIRSPDVTLHNFKFPFSGSAWNTFSVGVTGSIRFTTGAESHTEGGGGFRGGIYQSYRGEEGGVSLGRFTPLSGGASDLVNSAPAICVFFKPRMTGDRYVKELADRVVVTWELTEPYGNIQDFTWFPTVNRFQLVLFRTGVVEMSYQQLAAKDAVVGIYPMVSGSEKSLVTLPGSSKPSTPEYLDIENLKLSIVANLFLKVTFEMRGPALREGDPQLSGIGYQVSFGAGKQPIGHNASASPTADWVIRGFAFPRGPNPAVSHYFAFGPGISRGHQVEAEGNAISIEGLLPPELRGLRHIIVSAQAFARDSDVPVSTVAEHAVSLTGVDNPEVHFSSLTRNSGPFPVVYESFHYFNLPDPRDLSCTVIQALGDRFDFLAYYSDFRVDNQEAGTPSDGPRGSLGPPVTGLAPNGRGDARDLASYCSKGRFQWGFIQPIYSGAIQMQEWPPANAPIMKSPDDITHYKQQLDEINLNGKMPPYMYAMSQIGHEMDHRWAAFAWAKVSGKMISLGDPHWDPGLQVRVPFPWVRPTEASAMGGGVWQDNHNGTFTQLDDNYYVPATGYSYLDLYLMGLISPAEVPDFFLLQNLQYVGRDANDHAIFKADRLPLTIQDVISADGPREPDVDHSQRHFNTGMVIMVQHGMKPSQRLIDETNGIRQQWMQYFSIVTGRRATMTANP
jgi:hypothetical protein